MQRHAGALFAICFSGYARSWHDMPRFPPITNIHGVRRAANIVPNNPLFVVYHIMLSQLIRESERPSQRYCHSATVSDVEFLPFAIMFNSSRCVRVGITSAH
jgi:hypothetical protein